MKYNRRDFIKTGGMVMLGSLAVPSFLEGCAGSTADKAAGKPRLFKHRFRNGRTRPVRRPDRLCLR